MRAEADPLTLEIYRRIRELSPEQLAVLRQWCSDNPDLAETVEAATGGQESAAGGDTP